MEITGITDNVVIWTPEFKGFSKQPSVKAEYIMGNSICCVAIGLIKLGISNSKILEFTLPFKAVEHTVCNAFCVDNGCRMESIGKVFVEKGSNIAKATKPSGSWTNSGGKGIDNVFLVYQFK